MAQLVSVDGEAKGQVTAQDLVFVKVQVGTVMIIAVQLAALFRLFRHQIEHLKAQQLVQPYTDCLV
jgi:hypothetical protein